VVITHWSADVCAALTAILATMSSWWMASARSSNEYAMPPDAAHGDECRRGQNARPVQVYDPGFGGRIGRVGVVDGRYPAVDDRDASSSVSYRRR
jgi:hypothetical protein